MTRFPLAAVGLVLMVSGPLGAQDAVSEAMSAAPAEVAANATIMGPEGKVLREGTNRYTCMPTPPALEGPQPMCLDPVWMAWLDAWTNKREPKVTEVGIAYMLGGDAGVSNSDPAGLEPESADDWVSAEQHLMVLLPDKTTYKTFLSDPSWGGPWIMWKDTPYVHLMIPISEVEYQKEGMGER